MKAIILAGGGGTRLWPLSRESFPKQFLRFGSDLSLLQKTISRLENAHFIDCILIATNEKYYNLVQEQIQEIKSQKAIPFLEPFRRNTGPAIALAVKYLQTYHNLQNDPVIVLPSDHLIEPESLFNYFVENSIATAKENKIVTFGIKPTKPETGYGYIELASAFDKECFNVKRFIEKPNYSKALEYIKDPHFLWNSGMFMFLPATFFNEMKIHSPEIYSLLEAPYEVFSKEFEKCPDISIDYCLMEKSSLIVCKPLELTWSDIGSWDSLYEVLDKDQNENVLLGQVIGIETHKSLIFGNKRLIATVGVDNLLVIETEDAVFIAGKGQSQKVKNLVQELQNKKRKERLDHILQKKAFGSIKVLDQTETSCVQKITIFPQNKFQYSSNSSKQKWIALNSKIFINNQEINPEEVFEISNSDVWIKNSTDQIVELLLIEENFSSKATIDSLS